MISYHSCNSLSLNYQNYGIFEIDIFGTKGRLKIDLGTNRVQFFKPQNDLVYRLLSPSTIPLKKSNKSAIMLGVSNIVDCLNNKNIPLCTGLDGYKSLEIIIALIMSAKKNKQVLLPLTTNYKINSK